MKVTHSLKKLCSSKISVNKQDIIKVNTIDGFKKNEALRFWLQDFIERHGGYYKKELIDDNEHKAFFNVLGNIIGPLQLFVNPRFERVSMGMNPVEHSIKLIELELMAKNFGIEIDSNNQIYINAFRNKVASYQTSLNIFKLLNNLSFFKLFGANRLMRQSISCRSFFHKLLFKLSTQ
ncbi:MAG: hypothetical protein QNJ31_05555 [Candidatus Caenarcaniphilales bacterium]|nr:hypothetical protein [Candidatus Caenarcaniphilales bacterium]